MATGGAGEDEEQDNTANPRNRFIYVLGLLIKDADLLRKTPEKRVCRTGFKQVYGLTKKKLGKLLNSIKNVIIIVIIQLH